MLNDFIEYWAAAKLLLNGGNPYSPAELFDAQRQIGWSQSEPLMMWNPPWTLSFTFPFGWVDYETAQFAWFLLHALVVFVGAQALWRTYGGDSQNSRYAWLSVLTFAPTYFVLLLGQIGALMLLGLIGFLIFTREKAWGLAGASMTLVAVKPHLLYLLWLALFVWLANERQWKLFVGLILAGATVISIPLLFNVGIYSRYVELIGAGGVLRPLDWATPSLGTALGEFLAIHDMWIRWLPSVVGGFWFLWYWSRRAATWDWVSELPLILLVSVATASFAWTFDHIVLVPAVIQGAVWTAKSERKPQRRLVIGVYLALAAILLVAKVIVRNDFWYFWVAPAFLIFYLYVRASVGADLNEKSNSSS
jgi:Glycosyltransferase family 87